MRFICLSFLTLILFGCASVPPNTPKADSKLNEIYVGPGPEDIVLDQSSAYPRLLVSCAERRKKKHYGEIFEINLSDHSSKVLPRVDTPDSLQFRPHGIDLQLHDGKPYLYAISHEKSEKGTQHFIIKYLVEQDKLVYQDAYNDPEYTISPNDLAVAPNGEIYFSNDASKHGSLMQAALKMKTSSIGYYNPSTKKWALYDKGGMSYANGVAIRADKVYVSSVQSNRIFEYERAADGSLSNRKDLCEIPGLDNLTFNGENLVTTSHPKPVKFIKHAKNTTKLSPSVIYQAGLDGSAPIVLFADDGTRISAASTGLVYKDKLYIAQVFDSFVLEVDLED